MLTKDLVYLSLTALAGVIFYFHGYYNGLRKARRKQNEKVAQADLLCEDPGETPSSAALYFFRGTSTLIRTQDRGVFGRN
jgi:hypothetical protein